MNGTAGHLLANHLKLDFGCSGSWKGKGHHSHSKMKGFCWIRELAGLKVNLLIYHEAK